MATGEYNNLSEETSDFQCTACELDGKSVEAVKFCIDCQGYCCKDCTDTHSKFPLLKSHTLLDTSQGKRRSNRLPSLPEFSTERCCIHKGKVVDMYCEHHDVVCCRSCVSIDHSSCPYSQVHSIPDMVDTLFSLSECQGVDRHLRQLMVSVTSLKETKDDQINALMAAKDEAVQMIETSQKALEAVIKKAADKSRQELDDVYQNLENEILQDKSVIDKTNEDLQNIESKITKAEVNRVQRFVCMKIAKEKIIDAESTVAEQGKIKKDFEQLSFTPNQSLMDNISGLQSLGQIGISPKMKTDLYKVKSSRNIDVKVASDSVKSCVFDFCLINDDQLLAVDNHNATLKRIDINKLKVVDFCQVEHEVIKVCRISDKEAVVTCENPNKIRFISLGDKMTPTRQIEMSHYCLSIASMNDKLYITGGASKIYVHDMAGNLLSTIAHDNAGNKLFAHTHHATVNRKTNNLYVCDDDKIVCFNNLEDCVSTISDSELKFVSSVCFDDSNNMFVVEATSRNIVQFNEDGKRTGIVIQQDGFDGEPVSACFLQSQNMLFVAMENSNVMKMFELE